MAGGLMQLVAYGAQDLYLSGNPQMTFFKSVYMRYTNFSMEYIRQDFDKKPNLNTTTPTTYTAKIGRNGDLIGDIYVVIDLPNIFSTDIDNFEWTKDIGHVMIKSAELLIGGQIIDKQYGIWMNIWNEITPFNPSSFKRMVGRVESLTNPFPYYGSIDQGVQTIEDPLPGQIVYPSIPARRLYVPLEFWFCKNPGLFLPLIALQYNEVSIKIEFRPLNELFKIGSPPVSPAKLFNNPATPGEGKTNYEELFTLLNGEWGEDNIFWRYVNGTADPGVWGQNIYLDINYIFLDDEERRKFALSNHSYLIKQVQSRTFNGLSGTERVKLELQHPISEMMWVFRRDDVSQNNNWTNYTNFREPSDNAQIRELAECYNCLKRLDCAACPVEDNVYKSLRSITLKSGLTVEEFWTVINNDDTNNTANTQQNAFDIDINIMYKAKLILNTHDRMDEKDELFFDSVQTYKYHGQSPIDDPRKIGIYVYSFAFDPESYKQPSGTINMSRIEDAILEVVLKNPPQENIEVNANPNLDPDSPIYELGQITQVGLKYDMYFFATNYNILRIRGGMGGIAFAN